MAGEVMLSAGMKRSEVLMRLFRGRAEIWAATAATIFCWVNVTSSPEDGSDSLSQRVMMLRGFSSAAIEGSSIAPSRACSSTTSCQVEMPSAASVQSTSRLVSSTTHITSLILSHFSWTSFEGNEPAAAINRSASDIFRSCRITSFGLS